MRGGRGLSGLWPLWMSVWPDTAMGHHFTARNPNSLVVVAVVVVAVVVVVIFVVVGSSSSSAMMTMISNYDGDVDDYDGDDDDDS